MRSLYLKIKPHRTDDGKVSYAVCARRGAHEKDRCFFHDDQDIGDNEKLFDFVTGLLTDVVKDPVGFESDTGAETGPPKGIKEDGTPGSEPLLN